MPVVFQNELNPFVSGPMYQIGGAADPLMRAYEQEMQEYRAELAAGAGAGAGFGAGLGQLGGMTAGQWAYDNRLQNAQDSIYNNPSISDSMKEQLVSQISLERKMGKGGLNRLGMGSTDFRQPWTVADTLNSAQQITMNGLNTGLIAAQLGQNGPVAIREMSGGSRPWNSITPEAAAAGAVQMPNGGWAYPKANGDVGIIPPERQYVDPSQRNPTQWQMEQAYSEYLNRIPSVPIVNDAGVTIGFRPSEEPMSQRDYYNNVFKPWADIIGGSAAPLYSGESVLAPSSEVNVIQPSGKPGMSQRGADVQALPSTGTQQSTGVPAQQEAATTQANTYEARLDRARSAYRTLKPGSANWASSLEELEALQAELEARARKLR